MTAMEMAWSKDPLRIGSVFGDRIVERKRTVDHPADNLATIGHLGQRRRIGGRRHIRMHRLDSRENGHARFRDARADDLRERERGGEQPSACQRL